MARIPLGAKTVLNLATDLDPMFTELYAPVQGTIDYTGITNFLIGNGAGVRQVRINGGSAAGEGAVFVGNRAGANSYAIGNAGSILGGAETGDFLVYSYGAVPQRFYTNGSERMRIGAAGGVSMGTALSSALLTGVLATNNLAAFFQDFDVAGGAAGASLQLGARSGSALTPGAGLFGVLLTANTGELRFTTRSAGALSERMTLQSAGHLTPAIDNTQTLGASAARWSTVYAGTGAINTSDAREKTYVKALEQAELEAAMQLSREIGSFQWLESIDEKGGDGARIHIGLTVQRAIEVMESHGLEPMRYAFICYDRWDAQEIPARFEMHSETTGLLDQNGNEIMREWQEEVEPARTVPGGDRFGFRYDQLAMFILRAQEERQRRVEARLAALEAAA